MGLACRRDASRTRTRTRPYTGTHTHTRALTPARTGKPQEAAHARQHQLLLLLVLLSAAAACAAVQDKKERKHVSPLAGACGCIQGVRSGHGPSAGSGHWVFA